MGGSFLSPKYADSFLWNMQILLQVYVNENKQACPPRVMLSVCLVATASEHVQYPAHPQAEAAGLAFSSPKCLAELSLQFGAQCFWGRYSRERALSSMGEICFPGTRASWFPRALRTCFCIHWRSANQQNVLRVNQGLCSLCFFLALERKQLH